MIEALRISGYLLALPPLRLEFTTEGII